MRILPAACIIVVTALTALGEFSAVNAKSSSRSSSAASPRRSSRKNSGRAASAAAPPVSRRRESPYEDEGEDEELDADFDEFPGDKEEEEEEDYEEDMYDEEEEEEEEELRPMKQRQGGKPPPRKSNRSRSPPSSIRKPSSRKPSRKPSRRIVDDYEDEYDRRGPPPRRSSGGGRSSSSRRGGPPPPRRGSSGGGRRVVPYGVQAPSTFTRGLSALRGAIPDPAVVRDAATQAISATRETTSKLSANLYREVKGLTSSELEQVMLKATRPDDAPVKGKHVERLVGVTYQISARYDIYDAVLRKLWSKMAEKDWRTTIKALYILHRFSADGAPEHQAALKARLRELRRTRDPKRKDKYFNSKQLLAGDTTPENVKYRAFLSRYAHYVLLRAQCFGGVFDEISNDPSAGKSSSKKPVKPITSTALRPEHLEAATMLLKAGVACQLKEGEECENTALCAERVASDLIGLTTAVAIALNRALKGDSLKGADPAIIKRWCEFYSEELLPQTKSMVKKTSTKLDAYGLFLSSRMGASVSQEVLQKGLKLSETETTENEECAEGDKEEEVESGKAASAEEASTTEEASTKPVAEEEKDEGEVEEKEMEEDEDDEYDYEEEEYYDDEDA